MVHENLIKLATLIKDRRDELLGEWRNQVRDLAGARELDTPTINDEVPQLLDNLAGDLARDLEGSDEQTGAISTEHGLLRWQAGFDVTEVVSEYNILRKCLQDLAERDGVTINGKAAHIVHNLFDEAVGRAVKAFETMMTIELRHRHEEHIAFVLHDLRTPLEAVSLATTLLERSFQSEAGNMQAQSALSILRNNVSRIDDRLKHVLSGGIGIGPDFRPQFSLLNLREQVEKMSHDLSPIAKTSGTSVINDVPPEIEIYSEARLLAQILQNLLSNALKFTYQGSIVVSAQTEKDGSTRCWVRDTGKGIAPDRIDKVFERFETNGPQEHRGIGLGLSIVKEIVELHGGQIEVQSRIGEGATFTFTIPASEFD